MRYAPLLVLLALTILCLPAMADQVVPFAPLQNVTGNYTLSQGNDLWEINTNIPLSSQDIVYPEVFWEIIILIGFAFIFLAIIFVARSDSVPSIAILMCGTFTLGAGYVASKMAPLVGYTQVFHQVVPTTGSSGSIALNATNTVYVNAIIVYTQGPWSAYACWGLGTAGFIIMIAGALSFFRYFQKTGHSKALNSDYVEQDAQGNVPQTIRYREREPRRDR